MMLPPDVFILMPLFVITTFSPPLSSSIFAADICLLMAPPPLFRYAMMPPWLDAAHAYTMRCPPHFRHRYAAFDAATDATPLSADADMPLIITRFSPAAAMLLIITLRRLCFHISPPLRRRRFDGDCFRCYADAC